MASHSKALVSARKSLSHLRRATEDERLQSGGGSAGGGITAAVVDRDGVRTIGDTVPVNLVIGLGGFAACSLWKRMPVRGLFLGLSMGMIGAGSYVLAQQHILPAADEG
jgi:hypothetical protein